MVSQEHREKAERFLALHHSGKILILTNAWDPGSARLIAASGAKAIATTSMGIAATFGYPDRQQIPVYEMAEAIAKIVSAVHLPVSGDIEGGYGDSIDDLIASVTDLIATGIVGGNIEDSRNTPIELMDEMEFCERLQAIRALSDSLGFHFVINARTDVFLAKSGDPEKWLGEAIRRGNKYLEAGADCIFAPDLTDENKIATFVNEVNGPVNILVNPTNGAGLPPPIPKLEQMGVARVSYGSSILKSTLALTKKITEEAFSAGTYNMLTQMVEPISGTQEAYRRATEGLA